MERPRKITPAFRRAAARDIPELVVVERNSFSAPAYDNARFDAADFKNMLASASRHLVVAVFNDSAAKTRIAGYALVDVFRARGANLDSLGVDADCQGQGIGKALLAEAEKVAQQQGCETMTLEVHEENMRARALYRKSGYREIAAIPGYYGDGATALRLIKRL